MIVTVAPGFPFISSNETNPVNTCSISTCIRDMQNRVSDRKSEKTASVQISEQSLVARQECFRPTTAWIYQQVALLLRHSLRLYDVPQSVGLEHF